MTYGAVAERPYLRQRILGFYGGYVVLLLCAVHQAEAHTTTTMASAAEHPSFEAEHHWTWVHDGNKTLRVMCDSIPAEGQSFERNGTAWYHFLNGTTDDETHTQKDNYDRVFVKMGICEGCLNAGPAGYECGWCRDDVLDGTKWFGAVREAKSDDPNIATEINPLYIVSKLDKNVMKCSALDLANHWGGAAQLGYYDNRYYWKWLPRMEDILSGKEKISHPRPLCAGGKPTPSTKVLPAKHARSAGHLLPHTKKRRGPNDKNDSE